nr:MAG TPA: hypothetical protein [Caudoviricetes sp.]
MTRVRHLCRLNLSLSIEDEVSSRVLFMKMVAAEGSGSWWEF